MHKYVWLRGLGVLALIIGIPAVGIGLSYCGSTPDEPAVPALPSVSEYPSALPSAELLEVPPEAQWVVVENLPSIQGVWGEDGDGPWAEVDSRESAHSRGLTWPMPYPWRVRLKTVTHPEVWDCGFYAAAHDTWRVGYCKGGAVVGAERSARPITLELRGTELRIGVGGGIDAVMQRPEEK